MCPAKPLPGRSVGSERASAVNARIGGHLVSRHAAADRLDGLDAAHDRHRQVHQDDVEAVGGHRLHRLEPGPHGHDVSLEAGQHLGDDPPVARLILGKQDTGPEREEPVPGRGRTPTGPTRRAGRPASRSRVQGRASAVPASGGQLARAAGARISWRRPARAGGTRCASGTPAATTTSRVTSGSSSRGRTSTPARSRDAATTGTARAWPRTWALIPVMAGVSPGPETARGA